LSGGPTPATQIRSLPASYAMPADASPGPPGASTAPDP
jgi:hypothetical protein